MAESAGDLEKTTNVLSGDTGPGTGLSDLLPVPSGTQLATDQERKDVSNTLEQGASLSHALATGDHENVGQAQEYHDEPEVQDLGWNKSKENIAHPLVGGINNEELWLLVRRFNKVSKSRVVLRRSGVIKGDPHLHSTRSKCTISRRFPTQCPETSTSI